MQEAMYIYEMNKDVEAKIITPIGITESINLDEVVKQGTVGGQKMCGVSTDRINSMGKYIDEGVKYLVFVDDMLGMGSKEKIREMNRKMQVLEITKKFRFNTKEGKTQWMVIGKKEEGDDEDVDLNEKAGTYNKSD